MQPSLLFGYLNPFSNYNALFCATVSFECQVSFSLSFRCQLWALSVYKHGHCTATVSYLWSGFSKRLSGWLHKKKASFTNSTLCTVWTRQLLSAKDKQTDRERRQRERGNGRREQRGRHENMRAGEGAKQNLWKMQQRLVFQCVALTTCMKLGCHKMLNMVIISHTHTLDVWMSEHTQYTAAHFITETKRSQHGDISVIKQLTFFSP